ncbi:DUF3806 domain-containing protein [Cellulomonas sp. JZ18]|uniref:DUF3806 domain-containing protein n=1 Tax=Cellulomonas sp. JZ18 TaxID=2654191 RepID=UPI0012D4AC43|nr:DUF3806 domain-containing protein [Cellulomonas sp. JZ18]QGQ20390.1 DUF3806 domain-containing protein [Cellulomonas sp. JZ18]
MGLFDRRTPPQGSVLPTPHAPADAPLPVEEPGPDGAAATADAPGADADAPALDAPAPDVPADVPATDEDQDDEDEDELVLTPVWPARPGGPHDPATRAAQDDLTPLVPPVPAALARDEPDHGAGAPSADDPAHGDDEPPATDLGHTVDELNPAERIWLAQQRTLVADLCDDPADPAAVAALFDRVRTQWAQAEERPDHRPLADAFGVALGDLVVARAPALRWAAVSDRFGTEIVLAHDEPEVLVYPLASVAQYWEDARPGWFTDQVERLVQTVRTALPATG